MRKIDKPDDIGVITLTHLSQLGGLLRSARKKMNMTQAQMADKLGVTQGLVSLMESDPARARVGRVFHMLTVLGLDLVVQDKQPASKADW